MITPRPGKPKTIILEVRIGHRHLRTLLDTGASDNFISATVADDLGLTVTPPEQQSGAALPNGDFIRIRGTARMTISSGSFEADISAKTIDMPGFDLILGIGFCHNFAWQPDWSTGQHRVTDGTGNQHCLVPATTRVRDLHPEAELLDLMTERDVRRNLKRVQTGWVYWIRALPEVNALAVRPTMPKAKEPVTTVPDSGDPGINNILRDHQAIFREALPDDEKPTGSAPARTLQHTIINTSDHKPINLRAYGLTPLQHEEQQRQIELLLQRGLIQESSSPWGFPVLFVPKKDGNFRMCIDYRALNAVTLRNGYPLPRIQECLDQLGLAMYFSKIDLLSGYWQLWLWPEDRAKTAFNTRQGKYEFLVMPFGLTNAPSEFQTMINNVLRPFLGKFVIVYLDDILIFSLSIEDHRAHVNQVLEALKHAGLYANPNKCFFNRSEIEFCGHVVAHGAVKPMPEKLSVIKEWPAPRTVSEVRSFMGMVNYYRRYARSFATVSAPLNELLKIPKELKDQLPAGRGLPKKFPVRWTVRCQRAFDQLKNLLCSAPALRQPDTSKPFRIETDASEWAIGCVLMQEDEHKVWHPVAYDGRKLVDAETRYPVHEKELLGVRYALQTWRHYVDNGLPLTVVTDHESLKYLPTTKVASKRVARWVADFGEYPITLLYRKGTDNVVADAISRRPDFLASLGVPSALITALAEEPEVMPFMAAYLQGQRDFRECSERLVDRIRTESTHYVLGTDGEVRRKLDGGTDTAPYIEPIHRVHLMSKLHTDYCHLGSAALWGVIRLRGWWPGMKSDLRTFCGECAVCQVAARPLTDQRREAGVVVSATTLQPFERWGIDLIGILPTTPSGNRWIVTAVDYATGWPLAAALPDARAWRIAEFIHDEMFMHFGAPKELISDNGENFLANVVEQLARAMGTRHRLTTSYHPRSNGRVESLNGTLGRALTKLLVGQPTRLWDRYLSKALFACRIRTHDTHGTSAFRLVYGVEPRLPSDPVSGSLISTDVGDIVSRLPDLRTAREKAQERSHRRALLNKQRHDQLVRPHDLSAGDLVLVRNENTQKFEASWFGPYRVAALKPLGTYQLETLGGAPLRALVHGDRLVAARGSARGWWNNPAHQSELRQGVLPGTAIITQEIEDSTNAENMVVPVMRGRPRGQHPNAPDTSDPVPNSTAVDDPSEDRQQQTPAEAAPEDTAATAAPTAPVPETGPQRALVVRLRRPRRASPDRTTVAPPAHDPSAPETLRTEVAPRQRLLVRLRRPSMASPSVTGRPVTDPATASTAGRDGTAAAANNTGPGERPGTPVPLRRSSRLRDRDTTVATVPLPAGLTAGTAAREDVPPVPTAVRRSLRLSAGTR